MRKKLLAWCLTLIMLILCVPTPALAAENSYVRVLLTTNGAASQTVQINGNYVLTQRPDLTLVNGTYYTITNSGGTLTISGGNIGSASIGTSITLTHYTDAAGNIGYLYMREINRSYRGDITFNAYYGAVQCINRVYIEDYVIGVIRGEMGNSFPLEALKAQAVAARTYVYNRMKSSNSYDIGDTSSDQVYRGYKSADTVCIQAVEATKGQIVHYGSQVVDTYYGASNGGQTELIGNKWSDRGSGPWSQMVSDEYDLRNPESPVDSINVSKSGSISNYSLDSLLRQKMNGYYGSILGVESITLSNPRKIASGSDTSRYYMNITFNLILPADGGNYGSYTPSYDYGTGTSGTSGGSSSGGAVGGGVIGALSVSQNSLMRAIGGVISGGTNDTSTSGSTSSGGSSTISYNGTTKVQAVTLNTQTDLINIVSPSKKCSLFTVVDTGSALRIEARRYGHGVGMSQRGAQQMANESHLYTTILTFYYPQTTLQSHDFVRSDSLYTGTGGGTPGQTPDDGTGVDTTGTGTGSSGILGTGTVTASTLNVRSAPSSTASKLSTLKRNATVTIVSDSGDFYGIQVGTTVGYVSKQYISAVITTPAPTAAATPTPTPTPSGGYEGMIVIPNDESATLYEGAGSIYNSVRLLEHGERVTIKGTSGEWSQVVAVKDGKQGYVLTKYILTITGSPSGTISDGGGAVVGGGIAGTVTATPTPTPTPTPGSTGTTNTQTPGLAGGLVYGASTTATPTPVPTSATPTPTPVAATPTPIPVQNSTTGTIVNSGGGLINMRSGPATSYSVVARVGNGQTVEVLAKNGDWYRINVNGYVGYIRSDLISYSGTAQEESSLSMTTGTYYLVLETAESKMRLRSKPNTSSDSATLASLPHGTAVRATGESSGEWAKVSYQDKTGYIQKQYLSPQKLDPTGSAGGASSSSGAASSSAKSATTTANVYMRESADGKSASVQLVPKDTAVTLVEKGTEYSKCTYNGKTGYISTKYLKF